MYLLHPKCRVRKEKFGLLFYDLRGPKLLFVETGDLLDTGYFHVEGASKDVFAGTSHAERIRVDRLLKSLVVKGFLCEQSLC